MKQEAVIIGGGMGGLFTGAILAREGYCVTVLEKNAVAGGGLQTFERCGVQFDTGLHIAGGFGEGGTLRKICAYLGILNRLNVRRCDEDCADSLTYLSDSSTYRMGNGRENFEASLIGRFPGEAVGIHAYIDALYAITQEFDIYNLRISTELMPSLSADAQMPADAFIARYVDDVRLRDILAYMNPMYGGVAGHTPAYVHALLNVFFINGQYRFEGSSRQLTDALCDVIESSGGQVLTGAAVERVVVEEHSVRYVETVGAKKCRYTADSYISAVHPCELLRLTGEKAFPKAYRTRLAELPNSYSAFSLFLVMKEGMFPYINHTCYCQDDYGMVWNHAESEAWPTGLMYMTPPEVNQGQWARRMNINCIMRFDEVRRWELTPVGHRGPEYGVWKRRRVEDVISKMEQIYPGFRDMIEEVYAASPLTVRDYYHTKEGSIYGYRKDCENIMQTQLPVYTKVHNLYLTGQNVNLHGICGVPLTAIMTAEALVGRNKIIEKINQNYRNHGEN